MPPSVVVCTMAGFAVIVPGIGFVDLVMLIMQMAKIRALTVVKLLV